MARECTFTQGPPDLVEFFMPYEVTMDPGDGPFTVQLTTIGVDPPTENGFFNPSTPGQYRFTVYTEMND